MVIKISKSRLERHESSWKKNLELQKTLNLTTLGFLPASGNNLNRNTTNLSVVL
jgi:hypothetical protein